VAHHARRSAVGARETRENADQVVLPAPLGPSNPKNSPRDLEVYPRERLQLAEALVHVADLDRGRHAGVARAKNQLEADWSSSETP